MIELFKHNRNKLICILLAFVTIIAIVILLLGSQSFAANTNDSSIDSYKILYEGAKMNYECKLGIREWPKGVLEDPNMTVKDYEAEANYYKELMNNNIPESDYFNTNEPFLNNDSMRHATIGYMLLYVMAFFIVIASLSIPFIFAIDNNYSQITKSGISYLGVIILNLLVFIFGISFILKNASIPVLQSFGVNTITTTILIYYIVRSFGVLCISLFVCSVGDIIANLKKMRFVKYVFVFITYLILCLPYVLELGLKANNLAIIPITHIQFANNIVNSLVFWIGIIMCIMVVLGRLIYERCKKSIAIKIINIVQTN